jgi:hypothetical protein
MAIFFLPPDSEQRGRGPSGGRPGGGGAGGPVAGGGWEMGQNREEAEGNRSSCSPCARVVRGGGSA